MYSLILNYTYNNFNILKLYVGWLVIYRVINK